MDYSVYDAVRAGFGKVVFVIAKHFEDDFRAKVLSKYENHVAVEVVFQSVDKLPEGFTAPADRVKPWGTGHALLMTKGVVREPFAAINADDFYGRDSFRALAEFLTAHSDTKGEYCMVGFRIGNTLSESGTVARGVCETDATGYLTGVVERQGIASRDGVIGFTDEAGMVHTLDANTPVSMNIWGFTPDYIDASESYFREFLASNMDKPKSEFYIPTVVNELIHRSAASVKVLDTDSKWFGVTYAADRPDVVAKIEALVAAGEYPARLWGEQ